MPRLALYFLDNDETPRKLDTQSAPDLDEEGCPLWTVGRRRVSDTHGKSPSHIYFDKQTISREHAFIRCIEKHQRVRWQIKHVGTNRTFRKDADLPESELPVELPYGEWVDLNDEDEVYFVHRDLGFIVATSEDTFTEGNFLADDDEPTIGRPRIKEPEPVGETGRTLWDFLSELAPAIMNGPKGLSNWLWWLILFLGGLALSLLIVWLKYG